MIQFPFTAIVGLESAKRSLIFHAIDPQIGGTLFLGHRGCAKSTLVRAFAEILQAGVNPAAPFVELPLGTTEDRLLGSVNAEVLVANGMWSAKAGLIEQANGGLLYIDEVNLLPDHLADLILDSAASGQYRMERDGITRHLQSRYILVGTMNPEEGDLRPQLSDRFGHGVKIADEFSVEERRQIVELRMSFDDDPATFVESFREATQALKEQVSRAQRQLKQVTISQECRLSVAVQAQQLKLEGIRAELAVMRTARCAAAWDGRAAVGEADLAMAWELCLGHRHTLPPEPAAPPPPPLRRDSSGEAPRARATSQSPQEAAAEPVAIESGKSVYSDPLGAWVERRSDSGQAPARCVRASVAGNRASGSGSVAWTASVIAAMRDGWRPGAAGLTLLREIPARRLHVWCLLDGSRSAGVSGLMAKARQRLLGLAAEFKRARFHLLLIAGGQVVWAVRNATAGEFSRSLYSLEVAGGKSLIVEALQQLHRARLRHSWAGWHRMLIASDGLATGVAGDSLVQTQAKLRNSVRRLSGTGYPLAWLYPEAKRGLSGWLPRLWKGLAVEPFAL